MLTAAVTTFVRGSILAQLARMLLHLVVDTLQTVESCCCSTIALLLLLLLVRFSATRVDGIEVRNLFTTLHRLAQRLISCRIC